MSAIHFFEKGQGQPIVLIHGFCEIGEMWRDFAEALSTDFRVICPDLPGCGSTPIASDSIQMEEVAVLFEEWMEENNIHNPIVIGHSLGGYVMLALLELMGNKLKAVGLFHSSALADDEEKKGMRDRTVIFLKKHGVNTFVTSFVPPLFPEERREELSDEITQAIAQAKNCSLEGLIAFTKAMRDRKDRLEVLENFSGLKLVIAGTEDGAVKIDTSRKHKSAVTDYFELEHTGHVGMIERKEETLKIVREFCEKVSRSET
ncbi:pimeloyl-ACP methyl ester carboxylesterase [Algoriphagus ratkowskyi]|uniref:Alpha/beta hydrolase n=1 Tax=Algoriphagus ratkowskyi TaxID=57028 RepID=A0A2W7RUM1_9BACT|nr:alpha/beta hydrolase [Algoriphagus ratkowskyi]PZX58329.1 pimeloyl-ACP methyl ester carboxylesterase [Algoriphagus ratkowskyi]TXD77796.1 alpha/beta hydrolase [Algoriphagus ratkowskyi]